MKTELCDFLTRHGWSITPYDPLLDKYTVWLRVQLERHLRVDIFKAQEEVYHGVNRADMTAHTRELLYYPRDHFTLEEGKIIPEVPNGRRWQTPLLNLSDDSSFTGVAEVFCEQVRTTKLVTRTNLQQNLTFKICYRCGVGTVTTNETN